jgi:hypothetical protein
MRAALTLIAAMAAGSAALADPPKSHTPYPAHRKAPVEVALASGDTASRRAPESVQTNAAPAKRRPARVTTCRCGDPAVDPETREQ